MTATILRFPAAAPPPPQPLDFQELTYGVALAVARKHFPGSTEEECTAFARDIMFRISLLASARLPEPPPFLTSPT